MAQQSPEAEALRPPDEAGSSRTQSVIANVTSEIGRVIVGQDQLIERLLVALLTGQHALIEGAPGLAKTLTVSTLARTLKLSFSRIQFTPDLLPADITGTLVFQQSDGQFRLRRGPLFANVILADEINRAPAKVQSALLEAMQERQVTIGGTSYPLPEPFFVLATQNPIEHEGTYPLPEAQLDRFMLKILVGYPGSRVRAQHHPPRARAGGRRGGARRRPARPRGADPREPADRGERAHPRVHRAAPRGDA